MKMRTRRFLGLLLGVMLLVSILPGAAAKENALYSWTASAIEVDRKKVTSNLVSSNEADVRWNEAGVMYTDQGTRNVVIHNFLNQVSGYGSKSYGLPQAAGSSGVAAENLKVNIFPMVGTDGIEAVDLSLLYAYNPNGKSLNPANSGLLRVYVSEDSMTWSEDFVGVRSAQIVGCGTTQSGELVIYYEIHTENLMNIDGLTSGDNIRGVRIMPDGATGTPKGCFSVCEVTLTGYKDAAAFKAAVPVQSKPQSAVEMDEEEVRQIFVDAAVKSKASSSMGKILDALALVSSIQPASEQAFLNTAGIRVMDGVDTKAKDTIHELISRLLERDSTLTAEKAEQILADYESLETTGHILTNMNTPQQIFRAYAKSEPGDLLLRIIDGGANVSMVLESDPVFFPDGVNVDFVKSTMSYLTAKGETTQSFFELYTLQEFVPLTVSDLMNISWQMDVYASMADDVMVAVISDLSVEKCEITVGGTTVSVDDFGTKGPIYSNQKLTDAVAALADGRHEMTVAVTSGLGGTQTAVVEFEKKDGKATVLSAAVPSHDAVCQSKAMTDVDKNAWYHEAVDYALVNGIMGGYNATTFGPSDTLSRAMVVQVLYNKEGQPAISGKHDFTDVPADQWFNNAVTWGTKNGVMGGYGNGKFGPNDSVTVEQIAVILWNYAGNPAFSGNADSVGTHSGWAANALSWAVEKDILTGVPYENVTGAATRAQTAQMLMNYLEKN